MAMQFRLVIPDYQEFGEKPKPSARVTESIDAGFLGRAKAQIMDATDLEDWIEEFMFNKELGNRFYIERIPN